MAKKPRGKKPVYWTPPAASKPRAKAAQEPKKSAGGSPVPVYFERQVTLPGNSVIWRGWAEPMPPEYKQCPRCLAGEGEKHAPKCTKPDIKKLWDCPSCSAPIGKRHAFHCPRMPYDQSLYDQSAYNDPEFLKRTGFTCQVWFGGGHPTPVAARAKLYEVLRLHRAAKVFIAEPWREPILTKAEREAAREAARAAGKKGLPF